MERCSPFHPSSASVGHRPPVGAKPRYNLPMFFAKLGMHILEAMFFIGLIGSSVVVLISFVEDGKELFGEDEPILPRAETKP
jgi:hypothetical protein